MNARDKAGNTPLQGAAWFNKNSEVFITLLQNGADADLRNKNGRTALEIAGEC